jgi:type II secretory pathway pseudopilin PulG
MRGAATLMAVLFVLIVIGFALVVALGIASSDMHDSGAQSASVQALALAESGLERAAGRIANGTPCGSLAPDPGGSPALGNGSVTLVSAAPDAINPALCRVRVAGNVGRITRTVDAWLSGGGAIAFEASRSSAGTTSGRTMSVPMTVGAAGWVLVVGITLDAANSNVTGVTYAGRTLTQVAGAGNGNRPLAEIWILADPPVGASNVVVTYSNNDQTVVGALLFSGVDLTTPIDGAAYQATANNGTSATSTVTTVSDNAWVVDVLSLNNGVTPTMTPLTGRTERWNRPVGSSITGAGSTFGPRSPAGGVSLRWTWSGSRSWALSAVALRPAARPQLVGWSEVVN